MLNESLCRWVAIGGVVVLVMLCLLGLVILFSGGRRRYLCWAKFWVFLRWALWAGFPILYLIVRSRLYRPSCVFGF